MTIDTGDWYSQHPSDKQTPSRYLADQALAKVFDTKAAAGRADDAEFPTFAGHQMVCTMGQCHDD